MQLPGGQDDTEKLEANVGKPFIPDLLINQGKSCLLAWLQQVLLDACYAKLNGSSITTPDGELLEPVPHYYNSKSAYFLFLLNFHLQLAFSFEPDDSGKVRRPPRERAHTFLPCEPCDPSTDLEPKKFRSIGTVFRDSGATSYCK